MESYCYKCGARRALNRPPPSGSLMASSYQLDKFMKHTVPDPECNIQGVFLDPSTQAYQSYAVSASVSGSVVVQDDGRVRCSWVAGKLTGFTYQDGEIVQPSDAIKFVCLNVPGKEHPYPVSSTEFTSGSCQDCGTPIVY